MKWLSPDLLAKMSNWTDRTVDPPEGTAESEAFAEVIDQLSTLLWINDDGETHALDEVTENQRQAWCLISYVSAIPCDGMCIGVLVNEPEILEPIRRAATDMKSKPVLDLLARIHKIVPKSFFELQDSDERYEWMEKNEKKGDLLEELGESDLGEEARCDMGRLAVIIALDHPDEFFKAA